LFLTERRSVWLRRALFQVHLWVGIVIGLYVVVISLSGSAIVYRRELDRALCGHCEPPFVTWLAEFHDHLLIGRAGLLVNGVGAIAVTLMCITGAVIWWPGRSQCWRRMTIRTGVSARRFIWDLHNMLGFWLFLLVLIWAITSIYFAFPEAFSAVSDEVIAEMVRLHFGRAYGPFIRAAWVVLGLIPCVLFITGALMWWNRVFRKAEALPGNL
jgi:uncharacterized iron-regulated membrane protein